MFLDLYAQAGLSLYAGLGRGWDELSARMSEYSSSFLSRTTLYRADYLWLRGRLALADGGVDTLLEARRCAEELLKKPQPHHVVWARLLEAAVVARGGERERATAILQTAVEAALPLSMELYAKVAAHRQGELIGGADGERVLRVADDWLMRAGVHAPGRFCDFIAPGFRPNRAGA